MVVGGDVCALPFCLTSARIVCAVISASVHGKCHLLNILMMVSSGGGKLYIYIKVKVIPQQAWTGPRGSGSVKALDFLDIQHYEGGRSSAIRTGRLYSRRNP